MPPDEIETRLRHVENNHSKIEALISHLNASIDEIKEAIKEALDLKGRVDNYGSQLNQLWPRVDQQREASHEMDRKIDAITLSCETCRERIREEREWKGARTGNVADWLIKGLALAGIAYAMKEGFFK